MNILLGLVGVLKATTELTVAIASTQTPEQRKELWDRHLAATKWISDLLARFSEDISKHIAADIAKGN